MPPKHRPSLQRTHSSRTGLSGRPVGHVNLQLTSSNINAATVGKKHAHLQETRARSPHRVSSGNRIVSANRVRSKEHVDNHSTAHYAPRKAVKSALAAKRPKSDFTLASNSDDEEEEEDGWVSSTSTTAPSVNWEENRKVNGKAESRHAPPDGSRNDGANGTVLAQPALKVDVSRKQAKHAPPRAKASIGTVKFEDKPPYPPASNGPVTPRDFPKCQSQSAPTSPGQKDDDRPYSVAQAATQPPTPHTPGSPFVARPARSSRPSSIISSHLVLKRPHPLIRAQSHTLDDACYQDEEHHPTSAVAPLNVNAQLTSASPDSSYEPGRRSSISSGYSMKSGRTAYAGGPSRARTISLMSTSSAAISSLAQLPYGAAGVSNPFRHYRVRFRPVDYELEAGDAPAHPLLPPPYAMAHMGLLGYGVQHPGKQPANPLQDSWKRIDAVRAKRSAC
ncbi:hypothetical protein FISHEDRAFT_61798 [Fistulina hepatica ATCC 64428]|uniref:Uncharacterized protein n=1 Tax=Fistulina hepatica ATCC 64428 TaxID=1128425 RepID=A0A0D7A1A6_9AGAR|nr:hypothetical protein FISHEDRAFT_61798 [Fistulina hepatica ATCC 64428]